MDSLERYKLVVDQIKREEQLVNARLNWILAFEGFLFASISFLLKDQNQAEYAPFIAFLISIVGIIICCLGIMALNASAETKDRIKAYWYSQDYWEKEEMNPADFPPFHGKGKSKKRGRSLSYGIPSILIIFWVLIILRISII